MLCITLDLTKNSFGALVSSSETNQSKHKSNKPKSLGSSATDPNNIFGSVAASTKTAALQWSTKKAIQLVVYSQSQSNNTRQHYSDQTSIFICFEKFYTHPFVKQASGKNTSNHLCKVVK